MQFDPLNSAVEPSAWHALAKLKLDKLKLNADPIQIKAHWTPGRAVNTGSEQGQHAPLPASLFLDASSFLPETYLCA